MLNKLNKKINLLTVLLGFFLSQCDDPVSPIDKHIEKIWEVPLTESSSSGIAVSNNSLIFKTNVGLAGHLYKVSKDGKNIQTAPIGGCTQGIPVVHLNVIYNNNCVNSLYALNEIDLSVIWRKTDFTWIPIPAVDEKYVYVTDVDEVSALDRETGNTVWEKIIFGKNAANPVIEGDNLYFATWAIFQDGYFYAVNKYNGTINYQVTLPYIGEKSQFGGSLSGVSIWNNRIFVPADNRTLYCFEKFTGALLWSFEADAPMEIIPRVSDNIVYLGTLNRTCYALDVYSGALIWSYQGDGSISGEPSFFQNFVMFKALGGLLIFEKNTGKKILQMDGTSTDYGFFNAYWDSDGIIYATGYRQSDNQGVIVAYKFK